MGATIIGFVLGFALGLGTGTEVGALAGAVLGAMIGATFAGLGWLRNHSGSHPVVETHRVMCTPMGHVGEISFVGDLETKRWSEVKRCTLLPVMNRVDCDQGCVRRMNDSGVRPGEPCRCCQGDA